MLLSSLPGEVVEIVDFQRSFRFFVADPKDLIQRCHLGGMLYETEELEIIRRFSKSGLVFYDIGANVGNHSIFMAKALGAKRVFAFEANRRTAKILRLNIALNGVEEVVDSSYVGFGLGSSTGEFELFYPQRNNIGAARLRLPAVEDQRAQIEKPQRVLVVPPDDLSLSRPPDFVKIDVEGMELAVLEGMKRTIDAFRPTIFIEVDKKNSELFERWVIDNNYEVREKYKRYPTNENFLITPSNQGRSG